MHAPSSILAFLACLSLTSAAPAAAVVTVWETKTFYKNFKATKPTLAANNKAAVFKEAAVAPSPTSSASSPPPPPPPPPPPSTTTTTTPKQEPAPAPTQAPKPKGPSDPSLLTIQVTNKMNVAIQTKPGSNADLRYLMPKDFETIGTLAAGAESEITVPDKWAGRIAVAKDGTFQEGRMALIEASHYTSGLWPGSTIDVSYVDAWTVPIVCSCDGVPQSGCSDDLMNGATPCPMPFPGGCQNPKRGTLTNKMLNGADKFFQSCMGAAYTWDTDDNASLFGTCKGTISCCVGTEAQGCPKFNSAEKKKLAQRSPAA